MSESIIVSFGDQTIPVEIYDPATAAQVAAAATSAASAAASATSAAISATSAGASAAQAQAVVGGLDRFYATRAAGAAALATGEWFTSAEEGFLAWYERIAGSPNYEFRDLVYQVPVLKPLLQILPFGMHAAILAGTSTVDASVLMNAALADGLVLELPLFGRVAIEDTLRLHSHTGMKGTFGCEIWAAPDFGDNPLVGNVTGSPASDAARDVNITCEGVSADGNKAANSTATAFSHCFKFNAVDGLQVDVFARDAQGDGLSIQQSAGFGAVGSAHVTGKARTLRCARQGTAITCAEQVFLECQDNGSDLVALLLEPDNPSNFLRDMQLKLLSTGTGDSASPIGSVSGGCVVAGDGAGCIPRNITVDLNVRGCDGNGLAFRDAQGCTFRGSIFEPTQNGVSAIGGGFGPSDVTFDLKIYDPGNGCSFRETAGSTYDGQIAVYGPTGVGVQMEQSAGGNLQIRVRDAGDHGVILDGVSDTTFPNFDVQGSSGANLRILGSSSGNRFLFPRIADSTAAQAVIELTTVAGVGGAVTTGTPDDNVFLFGRIAQTVTLLGAASHVEAEPVAAVAAGTIETIRVPASDMIGMSGEAAAAGTLNAAGSGITVPVFDFDAASVESVNFAVPMPRGWNEGQVQAQMLWTASATGSVLWAVQAVAVSDDDVLSPSLGAESQINDAVTAAGDLMISAYSAAFTVTGSPAAEDLVLFRVFRYADQAGDTLAGDARLIAVRIKFTRTGDDS